MYDNSFPWVLHMLDAVYHTPNLLHNFEWTLPRAMKLWTFSSGDTGGHLGKTLEKARARFYWPHQRYDVRDWCNRCEICSSRKSPIPKSCAPLQFQLADQPMQRVVIDILGPLLETDHGNKYILVITSLNGKRPTPCLTWRQSQ